MFAFAFMAFTLCSTPAACYRKSIGRLRSTVEPQRGGSYFLLGMRGTQSIALFKCSVVVLPCPAKSSAFSFVIRS
jgi:hypothetical protein